MWPRTSNLRLDWWEVRKYEAQRLRERGASLYAVTSLGAAPLSQAGRQGKAGENATPRESAAAFAGQLECCGRIPRYTQRKRCRRCRLAPCIFVTAFQDAAALAWALGFLPRTLDPLCLVTPYARDLSALARLNEGRLLGMARRISTVGFCFFVGGGAGGFCLDLSASVSGTSGIGVGGGESWAGP